MYKVHTVSEYITVHTAVHSALLLTVFTSVVRSSCYIQYNTKQAYTITAHEVISSAACYLLVTDEIMIVSFNMLLMRKWRTLKHHWADNSEDLHWCSMWQWWFSEVSSVFRFVHRDLFVHVPNMFPQHAVQYAALVFVVHLSLRTSQQLSIINGMF